jgi:hypothetical protein
VLCGGLAFVMVVFSLVAGVDFTSAPLAALLAIVFTAYFASRYEGSLAPSR